jgi:hypothetical protein
MNKVMYPQIQPYINEALLFFNYRIMLCPNGETLSLHIVIALYHYRFGHICTHYHFVSLSLQENW